MFPVPHQLRRRRRHPVIGRRCVLPACPRRKPEVVAVSRWSYGTHRKRCRRSAGRYAVTRQSVENWRPDTGEAVCPRDPGGQHVDDWTPRRLDWTASMRFTAHILPVYFACRLACIRILAQGHAEQLPDYAALGRGRRQPTNSEFSQLTSPVGGCNVPGWMQKVRKAVITELAATATSVRLRKKTEKGIASKAVTSGVLWVLKHPITDIKCEK